MWRGRGLVYPWMVCGRNHHSSEAFSSSSGGVSCAVFFRVYCSARLATCKTLLGDWCGRFLYLGRLYCGAHALQTARALPNQSKLWGFVWTAFVRSAALGQGRVMQGESITPHRFLHASRSQV